MEGTPVVLDHGSGTCKIGFAGASVPAASVPAVALRGNHKHLVGDCAQQACKDDASKTLFYPSQNGVVISWDHVEKLWHSAFKAINAAPEGQPLLITEAPLNPTVNRERTAEILFESFDIPALTIQIPGNLSLQAMGERTGVVVDSGEGLSYTLPIYEGYVVPIAVQRLDIGGHDVTEMLATKLSEKPQHEYSIFNTSVGRLYAQDIKESQCYVARDYGSEDASEKRYKLPDGNTIALGPECYHCPELLFQPALRGEQSRFASGGLQDLVFQSITKCDIDMRRDLASNIVLVGGNALLPGFADRLKAELRMKPLCAERKVKVHHDPINSALIGGAIILTAMERHDRRWITQSEYDEQGVNIVRRKCPSLLTAGEQAFKAGA